jgi:hypothetical protein
MLDSIPPESAPDPDKSHFILSSTSWFSIPHNRGIIQNKNAFCSCFGAGKTKN